MAETPGQARHTAYLKSVLIMPTNVSLTNASHMAKSNITGVRILFYSFSVTLHVYYSREGVKN